MTRGWAFYALGKPAPQGSKKGYIRGGRVSMVESSQYVEPWRDSIMAAGIGRLHYLDGPLVVRMIFTMRRTTTARKKDRAPFRQPDLSKLCRAAEDAITQIGGWADDARIVSYQRLAKVWTGYDPEALPLPGVIVAAAEWTDHEPHLLPHVEQCVSECYRRTDTKRPAFPRSMEKAGRSVASPGQAED